MGGIYKILEWFMLIAYINLLWSIFLLLGLVVFGFSPATVAMFTVIRKLLKKEDFSIIKTFFGTYKEEFIKANVLGLVVVLAGYLIYLDFMFIGNVPGPLFYVLQVGMFFISVIYIVTNLYILPAFVHFDLKLIDYFKHAFLFGLFRPLMTIAMIIGLVLLYYLVIFIAGIIPLVALSLSAYIVVAFALIAFQRHENKQKRLIALKETD